MADDDSRGGLRHAGMRIAHELLGKGVPSKQVVLAVTKALSISERQGWRYFKAACQEMAATDQEMAGLRRTQRTAMLERIYEEAISSNQLGAAVAVVRQLCRMEGLEKPVEIEVSRNAKLRDPSLMTPGERQEEIERLLAKRARSLRANSENDNVPGSEPAVEAGSGD